MHIHRLEDAEIDLGAMPARQVGGMGDRVELAELRQTTVEVEPVDRAVGDGARSPRKAAGRDRRRAAQREGRPASR